MWGYVKFTYKVLNQTMQSQAKAKSSRYVSTLLRYYIVLSGNSLLMFQDYQSIPSSRVKKSNRENRARSKLTDTIFFLGTY